jgi:hypothetical protein
MQDLTHNYMPSKSLADFFNYSERELHHCIDLMRCKMDEYVTEDNFWQHIEETAEQADCHPITVWKIFFNKHLIALRKHLAKWTPPGEPPFAYNSDDIEHRIQDMINFLLMLSAYNALLPDMN